MSNQQLDIESIVVEVIRRIAETASRPAIPPASTGDWAINTRLLSLRQLPESLDEIRRVILHPATVVTPAVRDELRRRRITIAHTESAQGVAHPQSAEQARDVRTTGPTILIWNSNCPASWTRAWQRSGLQVIGEMNPTVPALIERMVQHARGNDRCTVVVTSEPAVAVCTANRQPNLRAIAPLEGQTLDATLRSLAANVLVWPDRPATLARLAAAAQLLWNCQGQTVPELLATPNTPMTGLHS